MRLVQQLDQRLVSSDPGLAWRRERLNEESEVTDVPYANNNGVRIHYQVEGNGPPLILLHGIWADGGDFRDAGYVSALLNDDLRIIVMDARGHGLSDKPYDPSSYSPELLAGDVFAVADHAGAAKFSFFGYSWGGVLPHIRRFLKDVARGAVIVQFPLSQRGN
jgi:pimeloyl-ACP methyl ester carboxylesterase